MRSNGAVHIGNDTFLAATQDVTDSLFLFSSAFPAEEQLAALPLGQRVHFHPDAALQCTAAELERYVTAARDSAKAKSGVTGGPAADKDATPPPFRHSLHASPDGHQVAVISNGLRHHYIIDIAVEPAAVCALEMPEIVRSVCWHPVTAHVLYVLHVSGDLTVYDTSRSNVGVVLPRHRRIALRPVIQRCLAEAEDAAVTTDTPSSSPPAAATNRKNAKVSHANKERKEAATVVPTSGGQQSSHTPLPLGARHPFTSPSVYRAKAKEAKEARKPEKDVIPIDKEPDEDADADVDPDDAANGTHRRTAPADLVDLYALAPTPSLPVILLVLSSSGDVYAVHLSDADTLPVLATAAAIDDGRVRDVAWQRKQLAAQQQETAAVNIEVHHLINGELAATEDEALAVRGCLVDDDAGTYAVFFCTASGTVRGAWVCEPDLLARHRVAHLRTTGGPNLSFNVRLDARGGAVRESLSPAVPSTTHAVTMTLTNNLCVIRFGSKGEATYLLALPCWDHQRGGWSCWQPTCETAEATRAARRALPLLSVDDAVPTPVVVRVPYDTCGASVGVGELELLLVPEVYAETPGPCERHRLLSVTLLSLLRSALYAQCGTLQLLPPVGVVRPPVATSGVQTRTAATSEAASSRAEVLALVNLIPQCHRNWLGAATQAETDAATAELAARVARQEKETAQRERMQAQRRERLMARVAVVEGRMAELKCTYDRWQQTLLDALVHRRGGVAVRTANERLGEVYKMLKEWEHQQ